MVGLLAILLSMSLIATVQATDTSSVKTTENANEKIGVQKTTLTDAQGVTEKKYKKAKTYTLTFNANGGKVKTNSKKLSYNKKLGTLPKPTHSAYTFQGWYTSKSGGKKVSANTKMPAKNMVVYAHWKKKGGNTAAANKIIGNWRLFKSELVMRGSPLQSEYVTATYYQNFDANGNFKYLKTSPTYVAGTSAQTITGKYTTSNGIIYLSNLVYTNLAGSTKTNLKNQQCKYSTGKDEYGEFLRIGLFSTSDDYPPTETMYTFRPA